MNQEIANKIFETDLGRQIDCFYYTSDDKVFIRREEAEMYKQPNTEIKIWFREGY